VPSSGQRSAGVGFRVLHLTFRLKVLGCTGFIDGAPSFREIAMLALVAKLLSGKNKRLRKDNE